MTADERRRIVLQLQRLIAQLEGPLPAAERAAGWTEQSQKAFLAAFERLRGELEAGTIPPPHAPSIAREMDHWGITGGRLLEETARLSLALRRLNDPDDH
jgi:hypothetical protein